MPERPEADDEAPSPARCVRCGTGSPSSPPPLGWSGGTERGRPHWVCSACVRDHLRSIEAKLGDTWW